MDSKKDFHAGEKSLRTVSTACAGEKARGYWIKQALKIVDPVFEALSRGQLVATMPVECQPGAVVDCRNSTYLEALGRSLAGIGPWLNLSPLNADAEEKERDHFFEKVVRSLELAVDPDAPDFMNFSRGRQPLVDAAFLAQGLLRSGNRLWSALTPQTQSRILDGLRQTRSILPGFNNWILFSTLIEAFLKVQGEQWDPLRIDYGLRQHDQWYLGDGYYGDGPPFHADYYNSYVIHPMLLDTLNAVADYSKEWSKLRGKMLIRARRHAAIQERLIGPDGTYPPLGRSLCYRGGAFQGLAQMALFGELPPELNTAQVRCALTAVIKRTLEAPGTFDSGGWLRIGLAGSQPSLGEVYISTGSLYLCSTLFLPLGLQPEQEFWSLPDEPWTACKIWEGGDLPADKAIS